MQFPLVEHIVWLVISYGVKYTTALYKKSQILVALVAKSVYQRVTMLSLTSFVKYKKTKRTKNKNELKDEIWQVVWHDDLLMLSYGRQFPLPKNKKK